MTAQYKEDALKQILETLLSSASGIRAAVIVNVDGLVVASFPTSDDFNNPTGDHSVAATSSIITGLAERTLKRLALGGLDRVMIEGQAGTIGLFPCTEDASLAVLIAKNAKLGISLAAAQKSANQIRTILNPNL